MLERQRRISRADALLTVRLWSVAQRKMALRAAIIDRPISSCLPGPRKRMAKPMGRAAEKRRERVRCRQEGKCLNCRKPAVHAYCPDCLPVRNAA